MNIVRPIPRGTGDPVPVIERVDCGAPHPFGICPVCGRGHGMVVWRREDNKEVTCK